MENFIKIKLLIKIKLWLIIAT